MQYVLSKHVSLMIIAMTCDKRSENTLLILFIRTQRQEIFIEALYSIMGGNCHTQFDFFIPQTIAVC